MPEYTIHGGDAGKQRLDILSRTLAASTVSFLQTAGLRPGLQCLDLGCGAGAVTLAIAAHLGEQGHITGYDVDERKIELAREAAEQQGVGNVTFAVLDAYAVEAVEAYDGVYSRFLLSHLSKPQVVLQKMCAALKPRGLLLVEDTDFSGHFCWPPSDDFTQYVALYQALLHQRGADANFGQKLVGCFQEIGLEDVQVQVSQPVHLTGEGKQMAEITFEGITGALLEAGLLTLPMSKRIQAGLVAFRQRENTLMSLPRVFQVRGRRG